MESLMTDHGMLLRDDRGCALFLPETMKLYALDLPRRTQLAAISDWLDTQMTPQPVPQAAVLRPRKLPSNARGSSSSHRVSAPPAHGVFLTTDNLMAYVPGPLKSLSTPEFQRHLDRAVSP